MKKINSAFYKKIYVLLIALIGIIFFMNYSFSSQPPSHSVSALTFDTINPSDMAGTIQALTPNPSAMAATIQEKLSSAPQAPFDFPNLYPTYYYFAKTRIFDNHEFWTIQQPGVCQDVSGLIVYKTGPQTAKSGDNITYTIYVTYTGQADAVIEDTYPSSLQFVSATGNITTSGNIVSWDLANNALQQNPPHNYTFTITLKVIQDNVEVQNSVCGKETVAGTGFTPSPPAPSNNPFANNNFGCLTNGGMPKTCQNASGPILAGICQTIIGAAKNNFQCLDTGCDINNPSLTNKYCGNDQFCDAGSNNSVKGRAPCTQVSNCKCGGLLGAFGGFSCTNSYGQTYNDVCPQGQVCNESVTAGIPCAAPRNCSCTSGNNISCTNYSVSCNLNNNEICDPKTLTTAAACSAPTDCTCTGTHTSTGQPCRPGDRFCVTYYDYSCTNSNNQTYSSTCGSFKTCTVGQKTSGIPCH